MGRVVFRAFVCGMAGLIAWAVTEPFAPRFIPLDPDQHVGAGQGWLILLIGGFVGLAAGVLQGASKGSRRQTIELGLLGLFFGAIGSTFGASIGEGLTRMVMHVPTGGIAYMDMPQRMVARELSILPIGLCMGLAIGITLKSKRGVMAGIVGGAIGGIVTGFAFDSLAGVLGNWMAGMQSGVQVPPGMMIEVGGPSRALMAAGLGVAVGLFVALIDQVTRQAWVRLVLGRNEGREWPIDDDKTLIGRDERAHVPLFGDMSVTPLHAIIFKQGSQYVIQDQNTQVGIGVNSQRVPNATLNPGDTFQVGSHNLQFLMKESAARAMQEGRAHGQPMEGAAPSTPYMEGAAPSTPYMEGATPSTPYMEGVAPSTPQRQGPAPSTPNIGPVPQTPQPTQAVPTPAPTPGFSLVATAGRLIGQRFDLSVPIEAGREATGIALPHDPQASRRHAAFSPSPNGATVQDLGSTNGTFVNGNRVQSATLNRGDVVQIGSTVFRVE